LSAGAGGNRQHRQSRITLAQRWLRRSMGQIFNALLSRLGLANSRHAMRVQAFRREAARRIFELHKIDASLSTWRCCCCARKSWGSPSGFPVEWVNSPESKVRNRADSGGSSGTPRG